MQGVYAQLPPDCLFDELAPFTFASLRIYSLYQVFWQNHVCSHISFLHTN